VQMRKKEAVRLIEILFSLLREFWDHKLLTSRQPKLGTDL
jgi:hypothetical protein